MESMGITEARLRFAELFNRVLYQGARVVIRRRGKDGIALVPVEDLELLSDLEDQADIRAADAALAESDERIPYAEIRKELGL